MDTLDVGDMQFEDDIAGSTAEARVGGSVVILIVVQLVKIILK